MMMINNTEKFENELFYKWIDDIELRFKLTQCVREANVRRKESYTQKEITEIVKIPLTKVKQIENGTCKDFNAINNYINFLDCSILNYISPFN